MVARGVLAARGMREVRYEAGIRECEVIFITLMVYSLLW